MASIDQEVLDFVIECAVTGRRAPTLDELQHKWWRKGANDALRRLFHANVLICEVYAHNWRVIEVNVGEHRGKRTQERPGRRSKPYMVVGSRMGVAVLP